MISALSRFSSEGLLTKLIRQQIISDANEENVEETALLLTHG